MDINNCIFSGKIEWFSEKRVKNYNFGNISTRISLPKFSFNFKNKTHVIEGPGVWCSIRVSYENDVLIQKHQDILNNCKQNPYCIIFDGKISHYEIKPKDKDGVIIDGAPLEKRYKLDVSSNNISFSERPLPEINKCIFTGYIEEYNQNGSIVLKTSYRAKDKIGYKKIPLVYSADFDNSLKSSKILVFGRVCGKTPSQADNLYVVADEIIKIP